MVKWIQHDEGREIHVIDLLKLLNMRRLDRTFLRDHVFNNQLVKRFISSDYLAFFSNQMLYASTETVKESRYSGVLLPWPDNDWFNEFEPSDDNPIRNNRQPLHPVPANYNDPNVRNHRYADQDPIGGWGQPDQEWGDDDAGPIDWPE